MNYNPVPEHQGPPESKPDQDSGRPSQDRNMDGPKVEDPPSGGAPIEDPKGSMPYVVIYFFVLFTFITFSHCSRERWHYKVRAYSTKYLWF
jgi:hypothetical protein